MTRRLMFPLATCYLVLLNGFLAPAVAQYNDAYCQQVAGTLDIHWEWVGEPDGCTSIEFTDGTLEDAADGTVTMTGIGVSDGCVGTAAYTFTVSPDGLTLSGSDSMYGVPMVLTRTPTENCFVGDWGSGLWTYRAHIAADPFLGPVSVESHSWGRVKSSYR